MTTTLCACGCGEEITHPGASYAGGDDAERAKHRARAAYKRKAGPVAAGTRDAMAAMGLADDVPAAELAGRLASVATELARRVADMDSGAVARQIEAGTAAARIRAEEAEEQARRAIDKALALGEQVAAAVARADQADADAATATERAEDLSDRLAGAEKRAQAAYRAQVEADQARTDAVRDQDRAETLLAEVRAQVDRVKIQAEAQFKAQLTAALADARSAATDQAAALRSEISELKAQLSMARQAGAAAGWNDPLPDLSDIATPAKTVRRRAAVKPEAK